MKCLWAFCGSTARRILGLAALLASLGLSVDGRVLPPTQGTKPGQSLVEREEKLRHVPVHTSEFIPVHKALVRFECGEIRPPEALLTPDPVLEDLGDDLDVRISFIVGADGRVHSAFIANSGTPAENRAILRTVRRWRYRPGLCNGVPTEVEAQVLFAPR